MLARLFQTALVVVLASTRGEAQSAVAPYVFAERSGSHDSDDQAGLDDSRAGNHRNTLSFSLANQTAWDDNVLSNNAQRQSDLTFAFGPRVGIRQERKKSSLALDYEAGFQLYRWRPGYNALNQGLRVETGFQFHPNLSLRFRDASRYRTGIFQSVLGEGVASERGTPATLNETVFTPLARQLENDVIFDILYQESRQTSLTIFGGFRNRRFFEKFARPYELQDLRGASGGFQYSYRLNRTSTLGALLSYENLTFRASGRLVVQSALVSFGKRLSRNTTLEVFGGPQYARARDQFRIELPFFTIAGRVLRARWHGAAGGTFTFQSGPSLFQLSGQRLVTEGGGLVTSVSSSSSDLGVRRRLANRWSVGGDLQYAETSTLGGFLPGARIRGQRASASLERQLTEGLKARLGYDFIRQRVKGPVPFLANLDRNRVSLDLSYRFPVMALGR